MATRRDARHATISYIYAFECGNKDARSNFDEYLESRKIRNNAKAFANKLFEGVLESLSVLDEVIKGSIKDWDYMRLGSVEKSILRLGTYEILYTATDKAVIIDEALEITKHLLDGDKNVAFINAVLDNVYRPV